MAAKDLYEKDLYKILGVSRIIANASTKNAVNPQKSLRALSLRNF